MCSARWQTTGAARARRSTIDRWRVRVDVPRAEVSCARRIEVQLLAELARELPATPDREGSAAPEAACRIAHALGAELTWSCSLRWRAGSPAPLTAIVGLSAIGSAQGLRFARPLAACTEGARLALLDEAILTLPSRLREFAAAAARAHPAQVSSFREGSWIRVSFGRTMPHEDVGSTVGRVAWEQVALRCGARAR